jgi:FlaA1/EpsC-like NDP-sugar epimerase/lipopolysaccharide/colanic/teichoic acid biosynthesis glycosyltransferase
MSSTVAKRTFDIAGAGVGLIITAPVLLACTLAIKLDSRGPVLYRSTRVGQGGKHFNLIKLRSMRVKKDESPSRLTVGDSRVTGVGRLLRRSKLDELPQLLNVLKGDMSIVGPRPEDPRYVDDYTPGQRRVLCVKPGITSPASIKYRHEEALLVGANAEKDYISSILPQKLAMDLEYVWSRSFWADLKVVFRAFSSRLRDAALIAVARRLVPWYVIDAPVVFGSFFTAYYLRFIDTPNPSSLDSPSMLAIKLLPAAALYIAVNHLTRLDARVWRYATAAEALAVGRSCAASTGIVLLADLAMGWGRIRPIPLSVVLTGGFLTFSAFVTVRYRSRLLTGSWRKRQLSASRPAWAIRTLIYGAGEAGQLVAWRLLTLSEGSEYDLVGFLDDDGQKLGRQIHGIPVLGGREDLDRVVTGQRVNLIVLAMNNISGDEVRTILTAAQETSAKIRIAPDLFEWMSDKRGNPLREVRPEDLLGRKPHIGNTPTGREVISGRTVLVTGAAGSIGSELCRLLGSLQPQVLVALDSNESGLFDLATELRAARSDLRLETVIADITREEPVRRVFEKFRPDVIFHVAAYKHVPLMEDFPEEAARVNILGTWNVLNSARAISSERFVFISSDKAVNPTSIMGATKRIAEKLVSSTHQSPQGRATLPGPWCTTVRFGNVLGSRGSVVPTFAKQIAMGGPVTITDARMTRYFMDVSEAAALIIHATVLTTHQDLFMLDMGEEIRVDDLARKMIRMRGLRPEVDVDIVYTGVRAGEKLQEELHDLIENQIATSHPLIYKLTDSGQLGGADAIKVVKKIHQLVDSSDHFETIRVLRSLAVSLTVDAELRALPVVEDRQWRSLASTRAVS